MANYPMSEDEMKIRQYFNKLGNLSENEVLDYVNALNEKYGKHIDNYERDLLIKAKESIGSKESSLFVKINSLEKVAKNFKDVEEDLNFFESIGFKRDFGF